MPVSNPWPKPLGPPRVLAFKQNGFFVLISILTTFRTWYFEVEGQQQKQVLALALESVAATLQAISSL